MKRRKLHIDIETFCFLDVTEVGVYRYVEHNSFRIILFAYRWDDGPVIVIDCYNDEYPGESIPADVWAALTATDDSVEIWAHNANFEYVCISSYYGIQLRIDNWYCTMVAAAYLGLPLGLDNVGKVLALSEQKDAKGKALIKFFSAPYQSRKKGEGKVINRPEDFPEKWADFKEYNAQDVRVECEIEKYVLRFPPMPKQERAYWMQDQIINGNGISIDRPFIEAAIRTNTQTLAQVHAEMKSITGIDNPNSLPQLKAWLKAQGCEVASLNKDYLADSIDNDLLPPKVARVLELRRMGSRTSTSKYDTMLAMRCQDNRVRGTIQYYGANRTGRGAGRGVQPQNLKKTFSNEKQREQAPHLIDDALVIGKRAINLGVADLLYDDVPDIISKLVRTSLISAPGKSLVVSDFAAIEARVLAWMAGEQWILDAFAMGQDIYSVTASRMFDMPLEMCGKGTEMRAKGKVSVLALGYQGWVGALITMGALKEGLQEAELPAIAKGYRNTIPKTVKLWRKLEDAARHVIKNKTSYIVKGPYCDIRFSYEKGYLVITLPSGRRLYYYNARVDKNGKISYYGLQQEPGKPKIWQKIYTYGGKLAENITQAIARDILYNAMYNMRHMADLAILLHIHDEIVGEADDDKAAGVLEEMENIMSVGPSWAAGLPLKGDGYISKFYKKD